MLARKTIATWAGCWAVAAALAAGPGTAPAARAADAGPPAAADDLMARGGQAFRRGAFAEAASLWERAERAHAAAGRADGRVDALANAAAAYQWLGQHAAADRAIRRVDDQVAATADPARRAALLNAVGLAYTSGGRAGKAQTTFVDGLAAATEAGDDRLRAVLLNGLGNLLSSRRQYEDASTYYRQAAAVGAGDPAVEAHALVNAARAEAAQAAEAEAAGAFQPSDDRDPAAGARAVAWRRTAARRLADDALGRVARLDDGHAKACLLLSAGQVLRPVKADELAGPDDAARLTRRAFDAFDQAGRIAAAIGDRRTESYAVGYTAELYEKQKRFDDARVLNRRAVALAQQGQAPHALYRWQWQTGRLLREAKETERAIAALDRAVETLASVRNDLLLGRGNRSDGGTFRESVGPLFYDLADLLLARAKAAADPAEARALLFRARETVESLKSAEAEDYFQDPCVSLLKARTRTVDQVLAEVGPATAVVYMIPLADRLEILVGTAGNLERVESKVGSAELSAEVQRFRVALEDRGDNSYLEQAWRLHEWLIGPIEKLLNGRGIDTLVFVPDGPLRTIPMAALQDQGSKRFLVERYAVAVTPGLTLVDPAPTVRQGGRSLRCGLSQGAPPLPHVPEELRNVGRAYPGLELLDGTFTKERLRQELVANAFPIVHIASHAAFHGSVSDAILQTKDFPVSLDELEGMLQAGRFRDQPVAMLVLSACQTAVGDDRAALGLAGVAIRGGARSAVASLWSVNDRATAQVFTEFYTALQRDPSLSKAKALQQAQVKLFGERRYEHPGYWAPYLVIGNWR